VGQVSRYPHGAFCWVDLATPAVGEVQAFYAAMFGWQYDDMRADERVTYSLCRLEGEDVASIHEAGPGEPSAWGSFVAVDDVEAATSSARDL